MIVSNTCGRQPPQFRVLSDGQIVKVLHATLECLQRTGVNVHNEEARALLAAAGADVDGVRVRIPPHVIQDALVATPRSFTLWGRDGRPCIHVVPDRVYFGPGLTATHFVDPDSGERRLAQRGDAALAARVSDALPNIDYVMGMALIADPWPTLAPVYEFAEMLGNTVKPLMTWAYTVENLADNYRMALAIAGDVESLRRRPFFAFFSTYLSPLVHTEADVANVLWALERDIPVVYLGGGNVGVTAPITGAGLLVTDLAGALSGLAIMQLKRRGARVCLGAVPHPMDLMTARPAYGGPETSLYSAALADVSRYLGVPFMGAAGASESKVVDPQAAVESTVQVLVSALSGATLVHDIGFLDCADISSLELLVITDEIIAMARRLMRGIEITDDTLMLDLIDEIGPGGEFVSSVVTARRCRQEIWRPTLMDRQPWTAWAASGAGTMNDRARARLRAILANHRPLPLDEAVRVRIEAIEDEAEARLDARAHPILQLPKRRDAEVNA